MGPQKEWNNCYGKGRISIGLSTCEYEGTWKVGKASGEGKAKAVDGTWEYVGEMVEDDRHGQGTYTVFNAADNELVKYVGKWYKNRMSGFATATYVSGRKYIGNFYYNEPSGKGEMIWPDGTRLKGFFEDGKVSGFATTTWIDDPNVKERKVVKREAMYIDNVLNGPATIIYNDGTIEKVNYSNGKRNGEGVINFGNGVVFIGMFKNDKRNGVGKEIWDDNLTFEGIWENDEYIGTEKEVAEAKQKYDTIYDACILDKSETRDMSIREVLWAVKGTCEEIAENPSWWENFKYNR